MTVLYIYLGLCALGYVLALGSAIYEYCKGVYDPKFGPSLFSKMYWALVSMAACPIVNLITIPFFIINMVRNYHADFHTIDFSDKRVLVPIKEVNEKLNGYRWTSKMLEGCSHCGTSLNEHNLPQLKDELANRNKLTMMCPGCFFVMSASGVDELFTQWNKEHTSEKLAESFNTKKSKWEKFKYKVKLFFKTRHRTPVSNILGYQMSAADLAYFKRK